LQSLWKIVREADAADLDLALDATETVMAVAVVAATAAEEDSFSLITFLKSK